jgi:predicted ATPase
MVVLTLSPTPFDAYVVTLDEAGILQSLDESGQCAGEGIRGTAAKKTNHPSRLLSACRRHPRCRAAEKGDELAPSHGRSLTPRTTPYHIVEKKRCRHGITLFWLGEFDAALSLFKRCDSLRETAVRQALANVTAEDNYSMTMSYTGVSLAYLGYFDQARSRTAEGVLQARQVNHAYTLGHSLFFRCWAAQLANLPDEARPCIEELFELANEHGFAFLNAAAEFWRGWWLTVTGKVTEGAGLMANGYTMWRAVPAVLFATTILGSIAETEAKLARPADGLSRLAEAARLIEVADERYHEAELHRLQGDLLYTTDDPAAAEQSFHRALAVARRQNAKTFELRAAMSLARLWRAQGKPQQARELLAPVYGWFTEGFDARDLKEAKALLQELAS